MAAEKTKPKTDTEMTVAELPELHHPRKDVRFKASTKEAYYKRKAEGWVTEDVKKSRATAAKKTEGKKTESDGNVTGATS